MSTNKQTINDILLTRFLADELAADEKQQVLDWLRADEANQLYFDKLEQVWFESAKLEPKPLNVDTSAAWMNVQKRIENHEKEKTETQQVPLRSRRMIWLAAAGIVLVAALTFILNYQPAEQPVLLANSTTETLLDTLPDGSQITLSQGAQLAYTTSFGDEIRAVELSGKAFFDIERDTTKAFVIHAGIGGVEVLGTSFSVEVEHDSDIVVDVVSGTVRLFLPRVGADTLVLILQAGESGIISNQLRNIQKIEAQPTSLYWFDRSLKFRDKEFSEVMDVLELVYGVSFMPESKYMLSNMISVQFEDASIEEIMKVIAFTLDLEYEIENTIIYLREAEHE